MPESEAMITKIVGSVAQKFGGGKRAQLQFFVTGLHPRQDQQILGEAGHAGGILANDFQEITLISSEATPSSRVSA